MAQRRDASERGTEVETRARGAATAGQCSGEGKQDKGVGGALARERRVEQRSNVAGTSVAKEQWAQRGRVAPRLRRMLTRAVAAVEADTAATGGAAWSQWMQRGAA